MNQLNKAAKKNKNLIIIGTSILLLAVIAVVIINKKDTDINSKTNVTVNSNSDLVIPVSEISETAKFYPIEIDNVKLEVLAVKASDGTIRTAFNTCEVCYDSGRGYYKQQKDMLVCQNCGNQFTMDQVGLSKGGGCNPVPISDKNKTVDETNITISKEYLEEAKNIFANWKS